MKLFDVEPLRQRFNACAQGYDRVAVLQREIGERMIDRLQWIKLAPKTIIDVGSATGYCSMLLQRRYRVDGARVIAIDWAPEMLRQTARRSLWFRRPWVAVADAHKMPIASASCELIFSNLLLHWSNDTECFLKELRRLLKPGGLLLFSSFGPDTLTELRQSWAQADSHHHVHPFIDMHDIGDILLRCGFADPVMDVERLTLAYRGLDGLIRDLRQSGATNALRSRERGLLGRRRFQKMAASYEGFRQEGLLPASFEIVYGHAWAPSTAQRTAQPPREARIPIDSIGRVSREE